MLSVVWLAVFCLPGGPAVAARRPAFAAPGPSVATLYTLDDPASPISVVFNPTGARLIVTSKADGFVWANPSSGGGDTLTVNSVTQANGLNVSASVTKTGGPTFTVKYQLVPASGQLLVTLSGGTANIGNGVNFPYPFFAQGQGSTGFAVVPIHSGYVVPISATNLTAQFDALTSARMEWWGGTDSGNQRGWLGVAETDADYNLHTPAAVFEGQNVIGATPSYLGSNANTNHTQNLLSYDRVTHFQFLSSGGYVALAKQFRAWAAQNGLLKTLSEKDADDPDHKIEKLVGAPILYLWGDGRQTALLDALKNAGMARALIQVSLNDLDENKNFPCTEFPDSTGWCDAIRARGFQPGFYDIYNHIKTTTTATTCPYTGYFYLWPSTPSALAYVAANGTPKQDTTGWVTSALQQAQFAAVTRLPAHLSILNPDAYFFDTTCAVLGQEDYNSSPTYYASRAIDQANRYTLLNTAYSNPTKRLLTGTERGLSYAVPILHWGEGKMWMGDANGIADASVGVWNDFAYPQIMVDPIDLTTSNLLGTLLSDGYQAPLWDLVFHDCIITSVHWSRPHNKFVYAWDTADLWAMMRGQAPLLQLTYNGVKGQAFRTPATITDANGIAWTSRWTATGSRVMQTYNNVCGWHRQVGWWEMINHQRLTANRSVQCSEFSPDGGLSGKGIVVNLGVFDGNHSMTGTTWNGTMRGTALSVPVGQSATYSWINRTQIMNISTSTPGSTVLSFNAAPTQHYTLSSSPDLVSWTPITTFFNTTASSVAQQYADPLAGAPKKFYRLTIP